jgi:hypothetical protein
MEQHSILSSLGLGAMFVWYAFNTDKPEHQLLSLLFGLGFLGWGVFMGIMMIVGRPA